MLDILKCEKKLIFPIETYGKNYQCCNIHNFFH